MGPIPHHMHQSDAFAKLVGQKGKPEAYYFPPQYNQIQNNFPHTYMGLEPGTTKEDIRQCLEKWNKGDNGILFHARAYRLEPGAGWQINPGILHAPGSLVTYEPQVNSDVFAMFQSEVEGRIVGWELLIKDVPAGTSQGSRLPHQHARLGSQHKSRVSPRPTRPSPSPSRSLDEMKAEGYSEKWITYGTPYYSAKELTVLPGRSVTIKDAAAYGVIVTQGYGTMGKQPVITPSMIRFGEMTEDEVFVTASIAKEGVRIENSERIRSARHAQAFRSRKSGSTSTDTEIDL